jgi:hypothetical protein
MKIKTISILGMIMLLSVTIPAVYAKGPSGKAGKSNNQQLYLYEKDEDWDIVEDGAWGKMKYNLKSGKFRFNGHGLDAGEAYNLINFARVGTEWPATINNLAEGTVNSGGNMHIAGMFDYVDLEPDETDTRFGTEEDGAKIWLVSSADITLSADITVEPDQIVGWNPKKYLFEEALIKLHI